MTGKCFSHTRNATRLVFVLLVLVAGGCRSTISAEGTRPEGAVDDSGRASAAAFFRQPALSHVTISPDGSQIAALKARDGHELIFVRPTDGGALRPLAKLKRSAGRESMRVRHVAWASNTRLFVSVERPMARAVGVRARSSRVLVIDIESGTKRYLGKRWPRQEHMGAQDRVVSWLPDDPDHILLALRMSREDGAGVQRVHLDRGGLKTIVEHGAGVFHWAADHRGQVRAGWGEARSRSDDFLLARVDAEEPFEEILRWNPHEDDGFWFAGFTEDPGVLFVYRNSEAERLGLYRFDLETGELSDPVFEHAEFDVAWIETSDRDDRLVSIAYSTDRPQQKFVDAERGRIMARINAVLPNRTNRFTSVDRDERRFILWSSGDTTPPEYYVFDRDTDELALLSYAYPELRDAQLAEMKSITYAARDGLEIPGYLTLPASGGEPPYPLIVVPHGGPWSRDVWGWDPVVQFLASRGFAVLQPNFRGSDGYGRAFERRGYGRWGLEMQDDITDGVRWLVEQGVADPDRVGIYGASYGGYAALRALQKEPDLFRAGASFAGVTDIPKLLDHDQWYWGMLDDMEQLVGDRWSDRKRLAEASPARGADQIRAPVLIAHGTEDWRVNVDQAHRMIDALEGAGADVEAHLYQGEVHGFLDERNEIDFYTRLADFFERHLAPGDLSD